MKYLFIMIVIYVLGKTGADMFIERQATHFPDEKGKQLAREMNQKLPLTTDSIRVEHVSYENHVMNYSASLVDNRELNEEFKQIIQQKVRGIYCGSEALRRGGVSVKYDFSKLGMRSLNDKLKYEQWSVNVGPKDCG